jgi:hypothetical protein
LISREFWFSIYEPGVVASNPGGRANSFKWLCALRTTTYLLVGTFSGLRHAARMSACDQKRAEADFEDGFIPA